MRRISVHLFSLALLCWLAMPVAASAEAKPSAAKTPSAEKTASEAKTVLFLGPVPALASERLQAAGKAGPQRQQVLRLLERHPVPVAGRSVELFGETLAWRQLNPEQAAEAGPGIWFVQLQHPAFVKGSLSVSGVAAPQLYLNFQSVHAGSELALATGYQQLILFSDGRSDDEAVALTFTSSNDVTAQFKLSAKEPVNNRLLTNAETIHQLALSDDTNWMLLSFSGRTDASDMPLQRTELRDVSRNQIRHSWSGQVLSRAAFSPDNQWLSYIADNTLWLMNLASGELRTLLENQSDIGGYRWAPDSNSIVLQWTERDTSLHNAKAKVYRSMEDRWRGYRDISRLFQLDIQSGLVRALTVKEQSTALSDIRSDSRALLYTQRVNDRSAPPHARTALYELDLNSLESRYIGTFAHLNQVRYHRDQLLVVGGPNFADGAGINLPSDEYIANDYDGQLYRMDKEGQHIQALSENFDPAINSVAVNARGQVIAHVSEGDRSALYSVDVNRSRFQKLALSFDVIEQFALANDRGATVLAAGTGVATPQQLEMVRPGQRRATVLHSSSELYRHIQLGEVRDFHVENPTGDRIEGRYYLPPDFDASKQYPTIVYYYGGTTTVNRQFTGRYPFHHWAANGYVVYVVQPRGTIGYGQRFSALHVNAWGKYTADDIIYATERFVEAHDFIDRDRLGNIGASYGGFMTMYLATQTDLFSASVSHAGISALSSYWGQGWWGFLYSGIASRGSFPWNNHELYVGQSPLYMADKINTPLLLITGDSDVNVPAGESHQMYTALKLLGRDVALVTIPGEDHHIIDREKRYVWWDHLLGWFDKHLKEQPDWWQHLSH
ncbi:prolyl oligopeptidase family serine peptidase [Alkalimonas delamerensis]|uniref:Prolyl oligopeptidase family serine peptidase n=1 Tax=Alkalimonas delamerensis TaxID=265981 RepID=A0ABT9GR21_9GAMM|nr:prolyl oligopeptidase family serine peptidase [Alkalimonas delamerensis]MDP4529423.1 prolyl oligopeptidase family serine peptidase [Alkalimonas delamerensis]